MTRDTQSTPSGQRRRNWAVPLLLALSGWIVLAIVVTRVPTPARVTAVFAFTLICPGTALVRLLPLRDLLERMVLGAAIGLSLAALTSEAAAIGNNTAQAPIVLIALALACTAAALTEVAQGVSAR